MSGLSNQFINKKILIYGFGKTGKACFNYLKTKNTVKIFDDHKKNIKESISKRSLRSYDFDIILISPGIDLNKCNLSNFLKKNKKKIINELDVFYLNNLENKKITITGTNGKSTSSKLLYDVLKKKYKDVRLVGNIGKPILSEKNIKSNTLFVIEASSYQIEYSKYFKTDYAVILNISPDHLERHRTFAKYVNSKFKLIKNQDKGSFAYIHKNNFYINKILKNTKVRSKVYKINSKINSSFQAKITNKYFENRNNKTNLKFIIEISKKFNVKNNDILDVVNLFKALKYRQQIIYKSKNLLIINDSKSTSFSSTINILKSYRNIYWLVGGQAKKGDKFDLNKKYFKYIKAYIFGKNKSFFEKKFKNKIRYKTFSSIKRALIKVTYDIKKRPAYSNILFSPSAASFDQFKNFEARGEYFNFLIKKLKVIKAINGK